MSNLILGLILLISSFVIVRENNNFRLIIYFSFFSLIAASLYYLNEAPDVALAEVAIGSAFIPLIYTIAISKQKTFTVVRDMSESDILDCDFELCEKLLTEFCEFFKLDLVLETTTTDNSGDILGVFREVSVDLVIRKDEHKDGLILIGKSTNLMMKKLEQMAKSYPELRIGKVTDYETED